MTIGKFKAKINIYSLGAKLIIYFSIVLLTVCGGLGIFAYYSASQAVTNEIEKALIETLSPWPGQMRCG